MKLKQLLKVIDKDTYLYFEDNNYSTLCACYRYDFETHFNGHIYLEKEVEKIYAYKVKSIFTSKEQECLCVQFRGWEYAY